MKDGVSRGNVLLENYDLAAPYLRNALGKYLKRGNKVAIVAFSFLPKQASNLKQWETLYSKEKGIFYNWLVEPFTEYGITESTITFVNYFADTKESAAQKVREADVLYFTGGLPDLMMERLNEFELIDVLKTFDGVVLGCSAGAMIQLDEYHITPDWDYSNFGYYRGLPWLKDFCLEVHFEDSKEQKVSINKVIQERQKPLYAMKHNEAAMIIDNGEIQLLGNVRTFGRVELRRLGKPDVSAAVRIFLDDTVKKTYMVPDLNEVLLSRSFMEFQTVDWQDLFSNKSADLALLVEKSAASSEQSK